MSDTRIFAKIDVGYLENPKMQALIDEHPRAILLHLKCILYSRQHLTDGVVPMPMAMRMACASHEDGIAATLANLLVEDGHGNFIVHDYAEHNQTSNQVKSRSQAQTQNARRRWDANGNAIGNATRNANGIPNRNASGNAEKRREETTTGEVSPEVTELLDHLDQRIESNGAKKPTRSKGNVDAMRLLIDRDGRTPEQIHRVIDWATSDSFWRSNILSATKLRAKFDQLLIKAGGVSGIRAPRADFPEDLIG